MVSQSGFVLHTAPYKETSLLVDLFAKQFGRIRCVAKGYRRPNKKGGTQTLFPHTEHHFSWQGRGDLKTLTQAETLQTPRFLKNECLYAGLYVNELLYRLLHEHDPHEFLFEQYKLFLCQLNNGELDQRNLRRLELSMLESLGYGLNLSTDAETGFPVDPSSFYRYVPEHGLIKTKQLDATSTSEYLGKDLVSLSRDDLSEISTLRVAKALLRSVIDFYLDGRQLHSRELYRQYLKTDFKDDDTSFKGDSE